MSSVRVLVTSDYDPASTPPKYVLQRTYLDAVIAAGATPLVGAFGASAAGYLDLAHALIDQATKLVHEKLAIVMSKR